MFGVSTVLAIIIENKYQRFFLACLAVCLVILLIGVFCYSTNDFIDCNLIQQKVENLTKEKCYLFTSCEVVEKKSSKKPSSINNNLKAFEYEKRFEYDDWMDVTDIVDIESKIESSLRLLVKFEIEFDNVETEQSYKDHVEQFSKEVRGNCGEENEEIVRALNIDIGSIRNERMFDNLQISQDSFEYKMLQQFHWIFELIFWLLKMMYYDKTETIIIKKIITNKPSIRVITNYS